MIDYRIMQCNGQFIDPFAMTPAEVDIKVIASALSKICRFTGHLKKFYSVAQHSVHVAERIMHQVYDNDKYTPKEAKAMVLAALVHDGSEAYIADIASPVKRHRSMEAYRAIEQQIQMAVDQRFLIRLLPVCTRKLIDTADRDLCGLEAIQLGGWDIRNWPNMPLPSFHRELIALGPVKAEQMFMDFYREITE